MVSFFYSHPRLTFTRTDREAPLESIQLRRRFSLDILTRMLILALLAAALLVWKWDFVRGLYFHDQLTPTGMIINGAIVALFALGILKVIFLLLRYVREEWALDRYITNLETHAGDPLQRVPNNTIIARRHRTMERLWKANCPINHSALASTLVAAESTRTSLPKFINNILILTGVFGTIVSLSIALVGASNMLESSVNVGGMGMVIHGMSTALSTTITAIVCYLYFGYFFLKLNDVQTNLISGVEQVTTTYLIPRFQVQADNVLYEFSGLIRSLQGLVGQMEASQRTFEDVEKRMLETVEANRSRIEQVSEKMSGIQKTLIHGFRLPEESAEPVEQPSEAEAEWTATKDS